MPALTSPLDRARPGISDLDWCEFLARSESWQPTPGPLTVITAHPDNAVLGAGGLIYTWVKRGLPVTLVSVTDGEASAPGRADPSMIRHLELRNSLHALAASQVRVHRLGIADGEIGHHETALYKDLLHYVPDGATVLAPFEGDGLADHETVGRVCQQIARSQNVAIARYPIWLWHHTEPAAMTGCRWGRFGLNPQARAAKSKAIQCFESQLRPSLGAPNVPPHVLGYFNRSFEAVVL